MVSLLLCLIILAVVTSVDSFALNQKASNYFTSGQRYKSFELNAVLDEHDGDDPKGKVVSCETTGSCGSVRRAYKQELNDIREKKRQSNTPMEDNYLDMISGNKSEAKKSYSPFKKQYPPIVPPSA